MPAPAVIPALIAYVKVVAVKTLVVGFRSSEAGAENLGLRPPGRAGRLAKAGGGQVGRELSLG